MKSLCVFADHRWLAGCQRHPAQRGGAVLMEVRALAEQVLYGTTLADKLMTPGQLSDASPGRALTRVPEQPGRPPELNRKGRAAFPDLSDLSAAATRGQILHFFDNHELLALELMALALLRFPDAPAAWRRGVVHTLSEEQDHLRRYRARIEELGFAFGELPVNDYFWRTMKSMRSPSEYAVTMALTFEQANLDYCVFYRDQLATVGDTVTATLLEQVYQDEIGHVAFGRHWFDTWRTPPTEDLWHAFRRYLPPPLTPARAKGLIFDRAGRQRAGLDDAFIDRLQVCAASKGRPPVVWLTTLDSERACLGQAPSSAGRVLSADLAALALLEAQPGDVVHTPRLPQPAWLQSLAAAGVAVADVVDGPADGALVPGTGAVADVRPWGWSPDLVETWRPQRSRLQAGAQAGAALADEAFDPALLASKTWACAWLAEYLATRPSPYLHDGAGVVVDDLAAVVAQSALQGAVMVKAPLATAGRGLRRISGPLSAADRRWCERMLAAQGALVIQRHLDRQADVSLYLDIADDVRVVAVRRQLVDARGVWRGALCDRRLWGLTPAQRRFCHGGALAAWQDCGHAAGAALAAAGYRGPAVLDGAVFAHDDGSLALHPALEINSRRSMGRCALAAEALVADGVPALFTLVPCEQWRAHGAAWMAAYPLAPSSAGLRSGVVTLTDPDQAERVVALLAVGSAALRTVAAQVLPEITLG
ncbi:MAG: DUF455 family protein [Planctomycetota bacterium]|jgi:uncharacterized ferritin-like protein (DUF455 family)